MAEKHFVIAGAGIAGLLSAYMLLEVGHKVSIHSMDQISMNTPYSKCRLYWCLIESVAPSPLRFLFGMVRQFCRFGIWSNTQCITPVDALHTTRSTPPPPPVTHCIRIHTPVLICTCILYSIFYSQKEGTSEKVREALVHKRGRKLI